MAKDDETEDSEIEAAEDEGTEDYDTEAVVEADATEDSDSEATGEDEASDCKVDSDDTAFGSRSFHSPLAGVTNWRRGLTGGARLR